MGGSLGARAINDLAMEAAAELREKGFRLIHLTGNRDYERVKTFYETNGLAVTCIAFDRNIDRLISEADFAICRAGASSLFELYANALPALFVPYPYAAGDHQYFNAMYLVEKGMAYCLRESELTRENLTGVLEKDHTSLSQSLYDAFSPEGSRCIADHLLK